jgi:hypothetical protein
VPLVFLLLAAALLAFGFVGIRLRRRLLPRGLAHGDPEMAEAIFNNAGMLYRAPGLRRLRSLGIVELNYPFIGDLSVAVKGLERVLSSVR